MCSFAWSRTMMLVAVALFAACCGDDAPAIDAGPADGGVDAAPSPAEGMWKLVSEESGGEPIGTEGATRVNGLLEASSGRLGLGAVLVENDRLSATTGVI